MVRLIDADKLNIYDVSPAYGTCVMGVTEEDIELAPTVDAVPIEWINQRVKGLKIQLINADEDDVDLIWHLRDEIQTLTELIDYWKAEQEKQK